MRRKGRSGHGASVGRAGRVGGLARVEGKREARSGPTRNGPVRIRGRHGVGRRGDALDGAASSGPRPGRRGKEGRLGRAGSCAGLKREEKKFFK